MPNWTQNIISFGQDIPQKRFEEVMQKMLRAEQEKEGSSFSSIASLVKACNKQQAHFDFSVLVPVPHIPDEHIAKWCRDHWGTKWNAHNTDVDWKGRELCFQTAGGEPDKIISAFHEAYPDIPFTWLYAADDPAFGAGAVSVTDGVLTSFEPEEFSSDALGYYAECWGVSENLYQDEEGEWHWDG